MYTRCSYAACDVVFVISSDLQVLFLLFFVFEFLLCMPGAPILHPYGLFVISSDVICFSLIRCSFDCFDSDGIVP